jgi:hypothetical protein
MLISVMKDKNKNGVCVRRYGKSIKESVFNQLLWAAEVMGVAHLWESKVSIPELTYLPTGQKIIFRGADDVSKNCYNCENCCEDRCQTGELLFVCLTLVLTEVRVAGSTGDSAAKTAFFGFLEKYENDECNSEDEKSDTENVGCDNHFIKPPIRRIRRVFYVYR